MRERPFDQKAFDAQMQDPAARAVLAELAEMRERLLRTLGEKSPFMVCVSFRSPFSDKAQAIHQIKCIECELPDLLTAQAKNIGGMMEDHGLKVTEMLPKGPVAEKEANS